MAEKKVNLSFDGNDVDEILDVTLDINDWISFVTTGANIFTVIIDDASKFNTAKKVLMYEVYDGHSGDTPTTKPNTTGQNIEVKYTVYATASANINRTDPDAPPKIIILPHT
ncbi:MAG TPA: hypothetical protein VIZ21_09410 [Ignavibacteriaceae bacterium]